MQSTDHKSLLGSTLLITGCLIGAGILGLPLVILPYGFLLSLIPLFSIWFFMYLSGLMLLEVYVHEAKNINLMSLLEKNLGKKAKLLGSILFMFLFYALLTAYFNGSSIIIKDALSKLSPINISQQTALVIHGLIWIVIISFGTKKVDLINRGLVCLMILSYCILIAIGSLKTNLENITYSNLNIKHLLFAFPVFIVSFGFQNLIPTISHYLNYDVKRTKQALFRGTGLALIIYLIWNFVIIGMIPKMTDNISSSSTFFITQLFTHSSSSIILIINAFSFFAIVTSILAISLSFVNFISDTSENPKNRLLYTLYVIIPPLFFSWLNPKIFLIPLHIAGGIITICLFAILPAMMLWKIRYLNMANNQKIFPFGKFSLKIYFLISIAMIGLEVVHLLNNSP